MNQQPDQTDDFLTALQAQPAPAFAEALGRRLQAIPERETVWRRSLRGWLAPLAAAFVLLLGTGWLLRTAALAPGGDARPANPGAALSAVAITDAQQSLPVTLTRVPSWAPDGFILSSTVQVYRWLTGTEQHVDYVWAAANGDLITYSLQPTAQPLPAGGLSAEVLVHGSPAAFVEASTTPPREAQLSWDSQDVRASLIVHAAGFSRTQSMSQTLVNLIKMAESIQP